MNQRIVLPAAGALACLAIGLASLIAHGPGFIAGLERASARAAGNAGVVVRFATPQGWLTRHPELSGGAGLDEGARARIAAAIARVPGVGGVHWAAGSAPAGAAAPLHCQNDVEAIIKARSIRFSEASAAIDPASVEVLDEVAAALRPCRGGAIAITGHTDGAGDEAANVALSRARAEAVRWALVARGIPERELRAEGLGSSRPREGLDGADPANRRIEFSVIAKQPLRPTPVDTPGPG